MYITKTIVNQFEGEVGVESRPQRGSTFWLTFKLSEPEQNQGGIQRQFNTKYPRRPVIKMDFVNQAAAIEEEKLDFDVSSELS